MTNYLIRRIVQMLVVLFFSSIASYALLNLAPGGPLTGLRVSNDPRRRLTEEDIARIRSYFELDLFLPFRYTRWLIGQPRGPLEIGGQAYFSDFIVGCRKPITQDVELPNGKSEIRTVGCKEDVTLASLVGRRTSRGIFFGDFGNSWGILRDRPVSILLISRLPKTIQLAGTASLLALLIGVPLGIYSAIHQYSRFDYTFTTMAFIGSSMPTFFFGIIMILVLSIGLKSCFGLKDCAGWFYLPPGNAVGVRDYIIPGLGEVQAKSLTDQLLRMIMPTSVLTMVGVSTWSRFVRSSMLEVMRQDYVRTARAKGLLERVVILKHALRNALIPFVTIVVFELPGIFAGAIITETVFNWPGMGRLYFDALGRSDYPVAMAILFIIAVLTVIATLLRDVLYTVVDPRIRLS
jgi:peptide/nickel transport system permease protein